MFICGLKITKVSYKNVVPAVVKNPKKCGLSPPTLTFCPYVSFSIWESHFINSLSQRERVGVRGFLKFYAKVRSLEVFSNRHCEKRKRRSNPWIAALIAFAPHDVWNPSPLRSFAFKKLCARSASVV